MAELSMFWTTGTTGDGATTITEAQTTEFFGDMLTPNAVTGPHASQGVAVGVLGELAVTAGSGLVAVAGGRLIGEGYAYKNTASLNVTIPTPTANTRIDRIVVRVSHGTTRTARITRIAGTEGAAAPSLTQSAGVTWDLPLAQVSTTTAGAITVTDQRSYCHFATRVSTAMLDDSSVTSAKIADSSVTSAKIVDGTIVAGDLASNSVTTAKILDANVTTAKLADSSVTSAKIVDGTIQTADLADSIITSAKIADGTIQTADLANAIITLAKLAAASVDDTKIEARVPILAHRQGGDASNWMTAGTTLHTPGLVRIEVGRVSSAYNNGTNTQVIFPQAFANYPLVFAMANRSSGPCYAVVHEANASFFLFNVYDMSGNAVTTATISWIAIGPR